MPRTRRHINPLGMRVVVRIRKNTDKTEAGLYLPEGSKEGMQESLLAEVIDVASVYDEDMREDANISGIPLGVLVLIEKNTGVRVPWDENLRVVDTADVLALVEEMEIS